MEIENVLPSFLKNFFYALSDETLILRFSVTLKGKERSFLKKTFVNGGYLFT